MTIVLVVRPESPTVASSQPYLLSVVLTPETQPFVIGGPQLFDVQITNIGPTAVQAIVPYVQLELVGETGNEEFSSCGTPTEDFHASQSAAVKVGAKPSAATTETESDSKTEIPISLAPGQSTTIYNAADLNCTYPNLPIGTYSMISALLLDSPGQETTHVDSNFVPFTIAASSAITLPVSASTPPAIPSSATSHLQENLVSPSESLDFYQNYGQDDLSNGNASATLAKGGRLVRQLDGSGDPNLYIEIGDVSGVFGTSAASDEWYGHYGTWEDSAGNITTTVLGYSYPTGAHELHIGGSGTGDGSSLLIDGEDALEIPDVDAGPAIEMQEFLSNSNLSSGSFRSGTQNAYIQFQDLAGNYNFWTSPLQADSAYPTSQSSFDPNSSSVIFATTAVGSVGPSVVSRKSTFRRNVRHYPSAFKYSDNSSKFQSMQRDGPFRRGHMRFDPRFGRIETTTLLPFREALRTAVAFKSFEVSPSRLVWSISLTTKVPLKVSNRVFEIGTRVVNLVDAATGRLLSYSIMAKR